MKRSYLRNKFLNTKSDIDSNAYNKQHNLCVSLIKNEKNFFSNINKSDITGIKIFWKTIKPVFTDKIKQNLNQNLPKKTYLPGTLRVSEKIVSNFLFILFQS